MNEQWLPLCERISAAQSVLLICHIFPDGDTCGSALALRRAFLSLGKRVSVCCEQAVPSVYALLDGADGVTTPAALAGQTFDLALCVDVSDAGRMGQCAALFDAARATAQIDHHGTNPGYAGVNVIRSPLSATGVLAAELIERLGVALDMRMAECLYVAAATDTGSFKQANTDPEALMLGARCVACGFDLAALSRRVFDLRPLCQLKLFGAALDSQDVCHAGMLTTLTVSRADFDRCGASDEHTEGLVEMAFNTEGVRMAALLTEKAGNVKVSMRCVAPYNVAEVAKRFGGGGHALAAGCTLKEKTLAQAREAVRLACEEALTLQE